MVTVKLYGVLREEYGASPLVIESGSVREVLSHVAKTDVDEKFLRSCVMFVNNRPLRGAVRLSARLRDGDELALMPPVSGG